MKKIIEITKDFKIIPENFKNAGDIKILEYNDSEFKAQLSLVGGQNIEDYSQGTNVEIFGSNDMGLVYFETRVLDRANDILTLEAVQDYSIIQRREYSRVVLDGGNVKFVDLSDDVVLRADDISAGGMRFLCKQKLEIDKQYKIEISLANNMKINCSFQPVRVSEDNGNFLVSGKFVDLENIDRVVLVQYAFKIKMEEQNKEQ